MLIFIVFTVLCVSIDGFFYGLTIPNDKKAKISVLSIQTVIVFLMCLTTCVFGNVLNAVIPERYASLCGILFIVTGIYNLFELKKTPNKETKRYNSEILKTCAIGFIIGLDSAIANFTFAVMGITSIVYPFVFAFTHLTLGYVGTVVRNLERAKNFDKFCFIFPVFLIIHGCINIIEFFI